MPEVAEVRLIADNLRDFLKDKYLLELHVMDPVKIEKWINRNCPGIKEFNQRTKTYKYIKVIDVHTHGKFCYIECDNNIYIGISFGMSGNIRPEPTDSFLKVYRWKDKPISKSEYLKHCHIAFKFLNDINTSTKDIKDINTGDINTSDINTGDINTSDINTSDINTSDINTSDINTIYYHDIRRFGRFDFYYSKADLDKKLSKLGHDPLSHTTISNNDQIVQLFRKFNYQNICKALMEQELLAGVGNFIKSETLYSAKISPYAIISNIPDTALIDLYNAIIKIAKDDYNFGGCSLYTFSGVQGDQSSFKDTLKVYNHEMEKDANGYFIRRIPENLSPDKRSTFWVPEIQIIGVSPEKRLEESSERSSSNSNKMADFVQNAEKSPEKKSIKIKHLKVLNILPRKITIIK